MNKFFYCCIIFSAFIAQACNSSAPQTVSDTRKTGMAVQYVCIPCGYDCDTIVEKTAGTCGSCKMQLVDKSTIQFGSIAPVDLYKHIQQSGKDNVILLDVRTAAEFNGTAPDKFGRLKNAINIPVQQLPERLKELEGYKDKEIIVYCSHSHRSPQASYLLMQNGFKKVNNLQHGMHSWQQEVTDKESNDSLYMAQ
jgi:rhodanese-related sulfurtransferase